MLARQTDNDHRRTFAVRADVLAGYGTALVVGMSLRLYGLRHQIVVDDEWHALHHLLRFGYGGILTQFSESGDSIPLTFFYRIMADTVGLSELGLRAPSFMAGLASLVLLPAFWPREVRHGERVLFAWLLALSPILIFFSRCARPYSITLLLSIVGVLAFYRWWRGNRRAWAGLFVGCAVLAPYFNLACAPGLVAPFLFATLDCVCRRDSERTLHQLIPLVCGVATGSLPLLIVLGLGPDPVFSKLLVEPIAQGTVRGAGEFLSGTIHLPVIVGVLACATLGGRRLWLRNRHLTVYLACFAVLQVGGVLLLRPVGLGYAIVLSRYCLPVLPVLLLFVALGARQLDELAQRSIDRTRRPLASAALIGGLLVCGPLPGVYYWPNNFTNHGSLQFDYDHGDYFEQFRPPTVPHFYERLRRHEPGTWRLVEAPWHFYWHSYTYYQRLHRQWVVIGFVDPRTDRVRGGELPRGHSGLRFENFVHVADHDAIAARDVDYVIFHRNVIAEMAIPFPSLPVPTQPWIDEYRTRFGPPAYEDEYLTVFALSPAAKEIRLRKGVHSLPGDTQLVREY